MPRNIQDDIQNRWNLIATNDQCRNAKKRALEIIQEEHDEQYSRLKDYRLELLEDANNQMYPIAWAVVDKENEDNWVWFIEKLQSNLNLRDGDGFTVISDRQKGLLNGVSQLLPKAEHLMCARHIYANLKKCHPHRADMKGLFWKVAKSYNKAQYVKSLEKLKGYDMSVYDSVMQKESKKL